MLRSAFATIPSPSAPIEPRHARRVALLYALFGFLWILLSDRVLFRFFPDAWELSWLQSAKGMAFVAGTGLLLYVVLRRRERALYRSVGALHAVVEASPLAIVVLDLRRRIVLWNPAAKSLFGWSEQQVLGRRCPVVPPSRSDQVEALLGAALAGKAMSGVEIDGCRKDGSRVQVSLAVAPLRGADGESLGVLEIFDDLTEMRSREERLRLQAAALEAAANGILITDREGTILWVNPAFTQLTGYSAEEVLGKTPRLLQSGRHEPSFYEEVWRTIRSGRPWHGQFVNRRKDGTLYVDQQTITPVRDETGAITHFVGIEQDVSAEQEMAARLADLLYHDPLTGLPNRRLLAERAEQAFVVARRHGWQAAVVMLDLRRFKRVNESWGHEVGDRLLREVGERIGRKLRNGDVVSRFGGAEFVLLLDELDDAAAAALVARRLREALAAPLELEGRRLHLEARIGVALFPQDGESFEEVLQHAGAALSRAKATEGELQFYQSGLGERISEHLALEEELRQALADGTLSIFYQPVLDAERDVLFQAEALVRWRHPKRGLLLPEAFLPIAVESGLIADLDRWVLRTAAERMRHDPALRVALNLSSRSLDDPTLVDRVAEALAETGVRGERLCLEITEGAAMRDPERTVKILLRLKALGVWLALDDFGMGHSSLSYLKRFPVDLVKIDQSFVRGIGEDERDEQLIALVVSLARSLGFEVLAEGVESEAQLLWLRQAGCRFAQGNWIALPAPVG